MASLLLLLMAAPVAAAESPPAATTFESSSFDDPVVALVPQSTRTEREESRVESAAMYAEARVLYHRREFPAALRRMQRAWRYHPQAVQLLPEIIFLANSLRRTDETVRYALLAADKTNVDAMVLRQLALRLSSQQRWQEAYVIYQLLLKQDPASTEQQGLEVGDALLYFDMGRVCFLLQNYSKASDCFVRIQPLLENPEELSENETLQKMLIGQADRTYLLLAESYFADQRYDRAETMFRKADEAKPNRIQLDYHLARIAAKRGEDEAVLKLLDQHLGQSPDGFDSESLQLLADVLTRLKGEKDESAILDRLKPLADRDTAGAALLQFMGDWQRAKRRWGKAERWYLRLQEIDPDHAFSGLVNVYREKQQTSKLLDTLGRAAAAGIMLQDLDDLGERIVTDVTLCDKLIAETRRRLEVDRQATSLTGVPMAATDLAVAARRYEVADELFDVALQWKGDDVQGRALLNWGVDLLLDEQFSRAVELFRRGVEGNRLGVREDICRFYLVRSLAWSGEIDQALTSAEAAALASPDTLRLQSLPGWVMYVDKRYDEAETRYLAVLKRLDEVYDNPVVREEMRDVRLSLSNLCVQMGRMGQAEEWLEQVLDEFPEDIGALNDLGYLWTEQGKNLAWAQQMIQQAVDGDPDNIAYLDSMGWVYYRLGQYEDAVKWLEKAVAGGDPDGVILDHLGDAYRKANKLDMALETWRRAVQQFEKAEATAKRDAILDKISNLEKIRE